VQGAVDHEQPCGGPPGCHELRGQGQVQERPRGTDALGRFLEGLVGDAGHADQRDGHEKAEQNAARHEVTPVGRARSPAERGEDVRAGAIPGPGSEFQIALALLDAQPSVGLVDVLEDLDPDFRKRVQAGDILVAGENFGAGSSREQAPIALKAAGISVVVARSFARIFYRNAINIGLPVVEVADHDFAMGHQAQVDLSSGQVKNLSTGNLYKSAQMPQVMIDILNAGGLVNYLKTHGTYQMQGSST